MGKGEDDSQLESWLERYGEALRRAVRRIVPRRLGTGALDEIEQAVRIRLWKALESEKKIEHPTSYLHRMTINATLDEVRRRARRPESSLEALVEGTGSEFAPITSEPSAEARAHRRQTLEAVERCLQELSTDRARAVRCHLQGFTTSETASLFGWTEPKARNLTYRGLEQLRRRLALQGIDHGLEDVPH